MHSTQIRVMQLNDLQQALKFWETSAGVGLNESDTIEHLTDFLQRNPELSLVAVDNEEIVGAVLCGHDGRRGYLHHLAVSPNYQRQGIGTQLVERCLVALRERQILKCNVFVYSNNEDGSVFWRLQGWRDREDLRVMQTLTS